MKKAFLSKQEAELFNDLKSRFYNQGSYYAYFYNEKEVNKVFRDKENFFQAWYCGYEITPDNEFKLSLF